MVSYFVELAQSIDFGLHFDPYRDYENKSDS